MCAINYYFFTSLLESLESALPTKVYIRRR